MAQKPPLEIAIIGGSLTGLFAALPLATSNHHVHILERLPASQMSDQGAGLRIGPDVAAFLAPFLLSSGAGADAEKTSSSSSSYFLRMNELRILGRGGEVLTTVPIDGMITSWAVLWELVRRLFGKMCATGSSSSGGFFGEFVHGARVESVSEVEEVVEGAKKKKVRVEYVMDDEARKEMVVDLVVGADGASSVVRQIFLPEVKRTSAGYVTWRGLMSEGEVSAAELKADFVDKSTWGWSDESMFISYMVLGENGAMGEGERDLNWVWYEKLNEDELNRVLTDVDGEKRTFGVSYGKLRPEIVEGLRQRSSELLAPQFAEVIRKSKKVSVRVVTDVIATQTSFLDGKVVLLGDAAAGPRPHVAAATSQSAFHASRLRDYVQGSMTVEQWAKSTQEISLALCEAGLEMGRSNMSNEVKVEDKLAQHMAVMMKVSRHIARLTESSTLSDAGKVSTTSPGKD